MWEAWAQSLGWENSPGEGKVHPLQYLARESHGLYSPAAAKSLQSCRNLCNPIDGSPSGSQVPGILQAKNTGVGCHFLQWMKGKVKWSRGVMSNSSQPHGLQPTRLLRPQDFPGKSTGVGCHGLLQLYSPWGHKESDTTEQLSLSTFNLRCSETIFFWYNSLIFICSVVFIFCNRFHSKRALYCLIRVKIIAV